MSYLPSGDTELIARQGYGGLGATPITGTQAEAMRKKYVWKDGKCLNTETKVYYPGDQTKSNCQMFHGPAPAPSAVSKFMSGVVSWLAPKPAPTPGAAVAPAAGMPPWVIPVAVGAGALVLVLVLKKK